MLQIHLYAKIKKNYPVNYFNSQHGIYPERTAIQKQSIC